MWAVCKLTLPCLAQQQFILQTSHDAGAGERASNVEETIHVRFYLFEYSSMETSPRPKKIDGIRPISWFPKGLVTRAQKEASATWASPVAGVSPEHRKTNLWIVGKRCGETPWQVSHETRHAVVQTNLYIHSALLQLWSKTEKTFKVLSREWSLPEMFGCGRMRSYALSCALPSFGLRASLLCGDIVLECVAECGTYLWLISSIQVPSSETFLYSFEFTCTWQFQL